MSAKITKASEAVVARYSFSQQAADSAVLRTKAEAVRHTARYDAATDTYVVVRDAS